MITISGALRRIPVFRRIVPSAKKRIAALTWRGEFKIFNRYGAQFLLNRLNFVDREIAFYGDFEQAQLDEFFGAMRRTGCDVFIDIGANIGLYAVLAAAQGYDVIAFEPDERNAAQLQANLFINRLIDRVTLHRLAVSDMNGDLRFDHASARSTGQSRVSPSGGTTVRAVRLDDFLSMVDRRLFLKMDIEGHELPALSGMTKTLAANRCFLQVESLGENAPKVRSLLCGIGYSLMGHIGCDYWFANYDQ